jgi:hypothetical protein
MKVATHNIDWSVVIPPEQWSVYRCVLERLRAEGVPLALGGGLAIGVYTGQPRNTKDMDIYILPAHREQVISVMTSCGLCDYFEKKEYDRAWIYRGNQDDVIVDAIWAMANKRALVDHGWLDRGPVIRMFEEPVRVIPPEELIWSKLYVVQRDRCDWPDIMNLLHSVGRNLNWRHLADRVAEDLALLRAVVSMFSWVSPESARTLPQHVWNMLDLPVPVAQRDPEGRPGRSALLDSRPWFFDQIVSRAA